MKEIYFAGQKKYLNLMMIMQFKLWEITII